MRNLVQQDFFMVLMDSMVPLRALIEYCLIIFQKEKKIGESPLAPKASTGASDISHLKSRSLGSLRLRLAPRPGRAKCDFLPSSERVPLNC